MRTALLSMLAALAPLSALADDPVVPSFVEETEASGLAHSFTGEWEFIVGGGVATFDCSGDGMPEIAMAGGTASAALFLNRSDATDLHFERQESGLEMTGVSGLYALDIDGDAITDVVLLRVGENVAMRGLGGCRFERANEAWGMDGGDAWTPTFAATWEKGATWPTLAFGNYIDRTRPDEPWGSCTDNWLIRPDASGRRFAPPIPLTPSFCALSMLFTDWNRSGTPSLRVSNDREYYENGTEQLWHVEPGAAPRLYTAGEGWDRLRIWGMGIAADDLDGDGYNEYFLTSMGDNRMQRLTEPGPGARPRYAETAWANGVTAHRPYMGEDLRPSTAWHAQFADVNNDGRSDLFIAKGNVWDMPDFAMLDPNNLLLQREDGSFLEAGGTSGVGSIRESRGGALADLNADGRTDLVVVNRNQPAQVWRNAGPAGAWVAIDPLDAGAANRNAVNGWVEVRAGGTVQRREVTVGGGHAGGPFGPAHFGLGAATSAEARVIWPDGTEGPWREVTVGAVNAVTREP
jgi:hypothetical protein